MSDHWWPPFDSTEYVKPGEGTPLLAWNHRAVQVFGWDERDGGWIAHVRRIHGPKVDSENDRAEFGLTVRRWGMDAYRGRVPLCSCCGEPWPCMREVDERKARDQMAHLAGQVSKAYDGFCYACGEPITTRQRSILAPEPNVELPGFPPPGFHLRWSCRSGVDAYDRVRRRSLGAQWTPLVTDQPTLTEEAP